MVKNINCQLVYWGILRIYTHEINTMHDGMHMVWIKVAEIQLATIRMMMIRVAKIQMMNGLQLELIHTGHQQLERFVAARPVGRRQ